MSEQRSPEVQHNGSTPGAPTVVVRSVGAAVPSGRLAVSEIAAAWGEAGGKAVLAVCGSDEDVLTLSAAAAQQALAAAGVAPAEVDGLWWGTSRPPMAEGPSHAFLAAVLGLRENSGGILASGSAFAGMDALTAGWDAAAARAAGPVLVVAGDCLVPGLGTGGERTTGAGAVALLLERVPAAASTADGSAPAARLVARSTHTKPHLDRFRADGQDGTGDTYDGRLFREEELLPSVEAAVGGLGDQVPGGARWSVPDPDGRLGKVVARKLGAAEVVSDGVQRAIGDTGSAQPFFGALAALTGPGPLCVVANAAGRSTAVLVEVDAPVPGAREALGALSGGDRGTRAVSYASTLRARGLLAPQSDPVAMGVPPGSAAFVRGNEEMLTLEGRRCPACAMLNVPPSIHPVCVACGTEGGEIVPIARRGRVHTFVVNHTMPAPFEAPLPLVVVDLEDGARLLLQGMPEDAPDLAVDDPVVLVLRRYALERGAPVYGFKVARDPVADRGAATGKVPAGAANATGPAG